MPSSPALSRFLEQYTHRHPVHATALGIRLHDHELPEWSREAREDELDEFEALTVAMDDEQDASRDLTTLDASALRADAALIDAVHARASMDARQLAFESGYFADRNPALWIREALTGLHVIAREQRGSDTDDMASLAMRLHDVPRFLEALPQTITGPIPAAWRHVAQLAIADALQLDSSLITPWLRTHAAPADTESWLREAAATAVTAFREAGDWLEQAPVLDESPALGAEAYEALLRSVHLIAEPLDALRARVLQEDEAWWLAGAPLPELDDAWAPVPWPIPWLHSALDDAALGLVPAHGRPLDFPPIGSGATGLGALAARDTHVTLDALPGTFALDAWRAHAGPRDWRPLLTTMAALDLRLHCDAMAPEEAMERLQAEGGLLDDRVRAEAVVVGLSMHPGRAMAAWHGAHLLDQLHGVASARHGAPLSAPGFAQYAFQWGAIPVPLIARLLLAAP